MQSNQSMGGGVVVVVHHSQLPFALRWEGVVSLLVGPLQETKLIFRGHIQCIRYAFLLSPIPWCLKNEKSIQGKTLQGIGMLK